jgi:hypothetical protein
MIITESKLRNIVRNELKRFLIEQDVSLYPPEEGNINVELPQDDEQIKVTISAEEIAQAANQLAEEPSEEEDMTTSEPIDVYLNERKRR